MSIQGFTRETLIELINGTIENYFIILIVAYFIIHNSKLLKEIHNLILIDQLTGSYNGWFFDDYLEKVTSTRWQRSEPSINILLLDIDHFKHIIDTYGHNIGDEVLKKIVKDVIVHVGDRFYNIYSNLSFVKM